MDDRPNVALGTRSDSYTGDSWAEMKTPMLLIRCREGRVEAYMAELVPAKPSTDDDEVVLRYRLDDQPARLALWTRGASNESMFIPQSASFFQKLAKHSRLRVQYQSVFGSALTASFPIEGLARDLPRVTRACSPHVAEATEDATEGGE